VIWRARPSGWGRRKPQQLLTLVVEHKKCEELLKAIVGTTIDAISSIQRRCSRRRGVRVAGH
jgi:hypothetical protein